MMTKSQKAAIKVIDTLSSNYPEGRFRYQFKEFFHRHIVEVMPLSLFEDEQYSDDEYDAVHEFEKKYGETLLFVSADSLTRVTDPIYEKMGKKSELPCLDEPKLIGSMC